MLLWTDALAQTDHFQHLQRGLKTSLTSQPLASAASLANISIGATLISITPCMWNSRGTTERGAWLSITSPFTFPTVRLFKIQPFSCTVNKHTHTHVHTRTYMYKYGRFSVVASAFYDRALRLCVRFLFPGPAGRSWTKGRPRSLWTERSKGIVRI